jgi:hypothetical protein
LIAPTALFKEYKMNRRTSALALVMACAVLGGCAARAPSLYQWQDYQSHVDAYFRTDKLSPDVQMRMMEDDLRKIQASGAKPPPGYHAHLGLLYGQQGKLDQFAHQVEIEKQQFPESETFMDFLLRNFKKSTAKKAL